MIDYVTMRPLIIAIDGPSGAGKGTVARAIAGALGYRHVDSGAMYRAVGWKALRDGVAARRRSGGRGARRARAHRRSRATAVTIDGVDVTRAIRTPEIDRAAAAVARLPRVRAVLVERQRALGAGGGDRDGRARHRHGGVSRCRREDLSRCVAGGARAPPRRRSGAHRRPDARSPRSRRLLDRSATSSIARAPRRRSTPRPTPSSIDTTGKAIDEVVDEVMAVVEQKSELEARG